MERLIPSPSCQLPPAAIEALRKATIDAVLGEGAFAEMGHLPVAQVLGQSLRYANALLEAQKPGASKALMPGLTEVSLLDLGLLHEDAMFVSQVIALQDLAVANAVVADPDAEQGPTLAALADAARSHLVARYAAWKAEPGRRSAGFRVQTGDLGYLHPTSVLVGSASQLTPGNRPDDFALFVALPLVAPFLVKTEDCFVAPRLE